MEHAFFTALEINHWNNVYNIHGLYQTKNIKQKVSINPMRIVKLFSVPKSYCKMILMLLAIIDSNCLVAAQSVPPLQITRMDTNTLNSIRADFKGVNYNLVLAGPSKYVMPETYMQQGSIYYNYKPRKDDVILISYPGAGQFWFGELIWLLLNNLNFKTARSSRIIDKVVLLEKSLESNRPIKNLPVDSMKSRRFMRTYLPPSLIPKIVYVDTVRIIYVARNPKDTLISDFNSARSNRSVKFTGKLDKYWEYFRKNLTKSSPYWTHLQEGNILQTRVNFLFIYAEENPIELIKQVSSYLNTRYTDKQNQELLNYMNSRMTIVKEAWKKIFPTHLNDGINQWIKQHIGGLKFPNIKLLS